MGVSISNVGAADQERAIATLTMAFSADPVTRWLYPEADTYLKYFPQVVRAFGGRAFENSSAHAANDFVAAALWLPPGVGPEDEAMGRVLADSVPESRQEGVFAVLGQMGDFHPHEPHWYLPLIGVDPANQGQGYGSALLAHALAEVDRQHRPSYLESSNPRNIPLYQRHGFEVLGTIQEGGSPPITPMLRAAR